MRLGRTSAFGAHAVRVIRLTGVALALSAAACSGGKTLVLGDKSPPPYHFGAATPVSELASTSRTDNPTLTADLLEIYFTTDRVSGNGDVWFATRVAASDPFDTPAAVTAVNGSSFETSSAISADGLTLWFGSDRAGGVGGDDIWVSERPSRRGDWSTPVNVVALNTAFDDIPRPPGFQQRVMPLSSTATGPDNPSSGNYQTFLASRNGDGDPFGTPMAIPELDYATRSTVDGFLTDDGLTLFFSSAPLVVTPDAGDKKDAGATLDKDASSATADRDAGMATSDLYVAWRRSTSEPFDATQPLDDLNTGADERDPWLTPDGRTLYFTSDRGGVLNIYTAPVLTP